MTPAQQVGVVFGMQYVVRGYEDREDIAGKVVVLKEDDGSDCPYFDLIDNSSRGTVCINLSDLVLSGEESLIKKAPDFSINVGACSTSITLGVALTAAQVAAVLEAAGIK